MSDHRAIKGSTRYVAGVFQKSPLPPINTTTNTSLASALQPLVFQWLRSHAVDEDEVPSPMPMLMHAAVVAKGCNDLDLA